MKKWRSLLIFFFVFLGAAAIISRLIILQIVKSDIYKAWSIGQQSVYQEKVGERGKVFFRGGQVLATNISGGSIIIKPSEIKEKEETAKKLAVFAGWDEKSFLEKIKDDAPEQKIKKAFTEKELEEIKNMNLAGVYISEEKMESRRYPQDFLASHVIGFVGGDDTGQYGIEGYYNDTLSGTESTGGGGITSLFSGKGESINGKDVYLTIDYNIQAKAEKLLEGAKENFDAESSQIIVADPYTGAILAMANYPNYNPNNYFEASDFSVFQNASVQKLFEPGSVFKAITMAAALDKEKITPQTKYTDTGVVKVGGISLYNYDMRSYGERNMTEVLERSINTGAVFAEKQLGNVAFMDYISKFGFFEKTGVDLQGETYSENPEFKKGYEVNYLTAAFGQGIEITPVQLVRAFCTLANGGNKVDMRVVSKVVGEDGTKEIKQEQQGKIISEKTVSQLSAMLTSVIENGFAKKAKISGYYIAGKSGTAQVPFSSMGIPKKGYSDKTWQSFIGFAPVNNPQFVALVKLDNPKANTAEYSAMPIFRELSQYLIEYMQIPPDYNQ